MVFGSDQFTRRLPFGSAEAPWSHGNQKTEVCLSLPALHHTSAHPDSLTRTKTASSGMEGGEGKVCQLALRTTPPVWAKEGSNKWWKVRECVTIPGHQQRHFFLYDINAVHV